ncbi:MAG: tRNA (N(6)-L-threonylcarbamoyladenosine(37)-C(2))-methylthiotransferase MtaB [Bacteroidetes bacterium]|nr:tRNA (N(6)-L-threonylcarbamoyladenosine(37)-C(2))-methylthiotransferase MtaB [Bacteroidota bacterium]MCW5896133.1 tRNA (N(6)-L-threonylcarbamoyladenosine(37)-C(2))-methylthiotransferase MtaB [Bacteroidota bacterium]
MPKVAFHTLGCKLNYAETSILGKQFADRGFDIVDFGQQADVCVINTCSVTERANRECRQIIRRALRSSVKPIVVVTGCYAQLEPEQVASIEGVDYVLGAKEKFELLDHVTSLEKKPYPHVAVSEIQDVDSFGIGYSTHATDRTRAFLKVQDGCDYNCSFCTIPLARGASRSQSLRDCVEQSQLLVEQGYKEIVLTGVNVGDYGKNADTDLLTLLKALVKVEGLERIRISSIEPNLLTEEILHFVASEKKMAPHFHVPLQSGSDVILRGMRRRYTTQQYSDLIHRIKMTIPDCGIGVDVIVGFPGESDVLFQETHRFLAELPITYLHVFTYSERPNTPATGIDDPVEPRVRFQRNKALRILSQKKKDAFHLNMVGHEVQVLFEGDLEDGIRLGFSGNYVRVGMPAHCVGENELVGSRIVEPGKNFMLAERIDGRGGAVEAENAGKLLIETQGYL